MKEIKRIKQLIIKLNQASDEYYNNKPQSMTDKEWDLDFDELTKLESQTGIIFSNSPTQNAGYPVMDGLDKIKHSTPLLSLGKTKSIDKLIEFIGDREGVLMHKLDGGTQIVDYMNNKLNYLATRGSSATNEGQDITHNSSAIIGIPNKILYKDKIQVVGEGIMYKSKLEEINSKLPEDEKYANARNLANASSSMLDSKRVSERDIRFIAFSTLETNRFFETKMEELEYLKYRGFNVATHVLVTKDNLRTEVERMTSERDSLDFDIDGLVLAHNDIAYGLSLGKTSHHFKNAIAYKFGDEEVETILREIKLDVGKSGQISYVGIFDTVELCGSQVSKASLSNYSLINNLDIGIGDSIMVRKANEIIPQITDNLTRSGTYEKATECPVCGSELVHNGVHQFCENYYCERQIVGRLVHWCSRDAMNIEGMSEETIKAIRTIKIGLADRDKIILNEITDLYELEAFNEELLKLPRFGTRKVEKLLQAIENSKMMPLNNVLYGLSIPQVGRTASKKIANEFGSMDYLFLEDQLHNTAEAKLRELIGNSIADSVIKNLLNNSYLEYQIDILGKLGLTMTQPEEKKSSNILDGKVFCVTGKVFQFKNRKELQAKIEELGGKNGSGVTANTDFLLNNDSESKSSKNLKAIKLNVPIITEEDFMRMINLK